MTQQTFRQTIFCVLTLNFNIVSTLNCVSVIIQVYQTFYCIGTSDHINALKVVTRITQPLHRFCNQALHKELSLHKTQTKTMGLQYHIILTGQILVSLL